MKNIRDLEKIQEVTRGNKMECFKVYVNEIEGRIDSYYYRPEFVQFEKRIKKLRWKKIKNLSFDLKNGSTPSGGIFEDSGIPFFRSQDFNLFDFEIKQYITKQFHEKLNRSSIKNGDILLAVVGATLGVVGYVPNYIKEGNINQNIVRIRVIDKSVDPKYLVIMLSLNVGQKLIFREMTITTQAYLNNSQLGNIKVPIPSLETQKHIVQLMDDAYEIKKQKENEAQQFLDPINSYVLEELGIILPDLKDEMCYVVWVDEAKGKRIDPKKYTNKPKAVLKAISKSKYDKKELSNLIVRNISGEWGKDPLTKVPNDYILCNVLRNTNFDNQYNLNYESVAKRLIFKNEFENIRLKKDDILIEKSGGSPIQPVGRIALIEDLKGNYTFSNFLQLFRINQKECISAYLFTYLKAIYSLNYMEYLQNQTTGIKNLIMEEYLSIPIPLPPIQIQNKIAEEVKIRMQKAKQLQKEAKEVLEKAKVRIERIILGEEEI